MIVILMVHVLNAVDMCACRYRFVEQPSNAVMCNPYPTGRFITRCIVDYSTTEGIPLSIIWQSRERSGSNPQPLNVGISTTAEVNRIRSELTIPLAEATYEGHRFFCSVNFRNGTLVRNSQEFYLFPHSVLMGPPLDYPDCDESSAQSTLIEECIDPNYGQRPTTPPPTTPPPTTAPQTTTPPPTTTTTLPPTTPPQTTTPPETTTIMEAPPTTILPPPTMPPPTTPPPPPPPPPTTTLPPTTTRPVSATRNPFTFEEEILLYSSIVAAVILIVVIVVLVLCLCCWNRVCQRSQYCTCYSKY